MKLNNKGTASVVIITILTVLLVATLGYIGYDKFIAKDAEKNDNTETLKYEEVRKLYDSLVYESEEDYLYGLYFKEKVDSSNIMPFITLALKNYVREKNIKYYSFSYSEPGNSTSDPVGIEVGDDGKVVLFDQMTEQDGKIAKENFINYIKEKYGVKVTKDQITDMWYGDTTRVKNLGDYIVIGVRPTSGSDIKIYRDMKNYEQQGKDLIIYDTAVVRTYSAGFETLSQFIDYDSDNCIKSYNYTEDGKVVDDEGNEIDDSVFHSPIEEYVKKSLKDGTAGSYKHTFTLGSDNKYHWVSSEKINK